MPTCRGVRTLEGVAEGERYCFAAGTLVHSRDGLKPIERIAVGDWVLSQPERGGGERAYRRVTRTIAHEDKPVCRVRFHAQRNGELIAQEVLTTPTHPFYVTGYHNDGSFSDEYWEDLDKRIGWQPAEQLETHQLVQLANGETMHVSRPRRLWKTRTAGEAWIEINSDSNTGYLVRIRDGQAVGEFTTKSDADYSGVDDFDERNDSAESQEKWAYRCTVYNIEVEDFHTYYVGEQGVWVHNDTSCFERSIKRVRRADGRLTSPDLEVFPPIST